MYIQNLKIENWKNFQKGETQLGHRLFLIGPNASGKAIYNWDYHNGMGLLGTWK